MARSVGHRALPVSPQVMRICRAVPKIPAKSSHPAALPLHKNRALRTHLESTLPQLLIPLHFKSFIGNAYRKLQGEALPPARKFGNSLLPVRCSLAHTQTILNSIPFYGLLHTSLYTAECGARPDHRAPQRTSCFVFYPAGYPRGIK